MTGSKLRIGTMAGLLLAGVTALHARPATDASVALCELVIADETVPVQAEPVVLSVRHSASFGDTLTARLPAESRVRVLRVVNVGKVEPQTLRITLNTTEAVAGEYELVVDDGQAECIGTIRVAPQPVDRVHTASPGKASSADLIVQLLHGRRT